MTTLAVPAPPRLPVWQTVAACYATVAGNLGQLVRISWLWLLILLPVYVALHWLAWAWREEEGLPSTIVGVAAPIIELPLLASIAVTWHRLILRRERVTAWAYLRLDGSVWLYVLYSLLFGILVLAPTAPLLLPILDKSRHHVDVNCPGRSPVAILAAGAFVLIQGVALIVALAVALLVLPRLSLVLPAVALGESLSLRRTWPMTRANTLRLTLATALCILPGFLPSLPALWWTWTGATENQAFYVIGGLINSLGYAVFAIFAVTLLSLTYRFFVVRGGEGPSPPA